MLDPLICKRLLIFNFVLASQRDELLQPDAEGNAKTRSSRAKCETSRRVSVVIHWTTTWKRLSGKFESDWRRDNHEDFGILDDQMSNQEPTRPRSNVRSACTVSTGPS